MSHDPRDPERMRQMAKDEKLQSRAHELFLDSCRYNYSYNYSWLGRPVIQYPQDLMALQEILWRVKPDVVVETGIAHGGSLVFSASMLELIGRGRVLGVDIDIRPHNRAAIENHPMARRISMIQGSSVDDAIAARVRDETRGAKAVVVVLDSNHTHAHVLRELELYSPLVTRGSYLIVLDTVVEDMPKEFFPNRPWGPGDNPRTAVREFLRSNRRFQIDREIQDKLLLTTAPEGYLRCLAD
ncbi:MAG: cephalosporin hydroxylase family protein [Betaproteobacteria bacterium]|nr:cephalosporin hydroxylase family protein [Betaproteobacteria bacterium]